MTSLFTTVAAAAPPFFGEVVALLIAAAFIAYLAARRGMVPIVGFLATGVVIGPNALGLVRDRDLVDAAAEIGVILLLFTIGIEFSLEKLNRIRRAIFVAGTLQVILATAITTIICVWAGVPLGVAVFTGFLVALSSTAIVLKLLADRGETSSATGQTSLAILIFQDLAIIAIALLVPVLAGTAGTPAAIVWSLGKAVLVIVAVLVIARRVMPSVLELVARTCSPEVFLLAVIAICFGTAWVTGLAGVSLSLGAFLAGLLVSESRFSEHALGEVLPLQILFSATFFVSVGMLLDLRFLLSNALFILAAVVVVVVVKLATTFVAVRVLGASSAIATSVALLLAQVGEFSFVLERLGAQAGLSPAGQGDRGSQTFIAATVLLMMATPWLARLSSSARSRLESEKVAAPDPETEELVDMRDHVIVSGYGKTSRGLTRVLHGARVPFVIVTLSPAGAAEAEGEGFPVMIGDSARQRTLQLAGADRAKLLVIADDDPAMVHRITSVSRSINPTMRIVARTRLSSDAVPLEHAGVDLVISDEMESVVGLFADILGRYQIPLAEIERYEQMLRSHGYAAVRDLETAEQTIQPCHLDPHCLTTRTIRVRGGTPAATMSSTELRSTLAETGVELLIVTPPSGVGTTADVSPLEGSELTLKGAPETFLRSARLFQTEDEAAAQPPAEEARRTTVDTETLHHFAFEEAKCSHAEELDAVQPSAPGCEDCLLTGDSWVHLRLCLHCGHVGCCDSSPNRHATAHRERAGHELITSLEPGEQWAWCYAHSRTFDGFLRTGVAARDAAPQSVSD